MTAVARIFRRKNWHDDARWYARLRRTWLTLRGHETEICGRCGGPVNVWHAPEDVWLAYSGYQGGHGCLCLGCFDTVARAAGFKSFWECGRESLAYPSCTGQPCAHQEAMMIVGAQRDELWRELVEARGAAT